MNLVLLFVLVIIILIGLFYFLFFTYSSEYVYGLADLMNPPIEAIPATALKNPSSNRYAIGLWIYIKEWDNTDPKILLTKTAFSVVDKLFSLIEPKYDFCLYIQGRNLVCQFASIQEGITITPITIMKDIPLQKWMNVSLSIDSQILDVYIDGKLVISRKLESLPKNSDAGIIFGNSIPTNIYINHMKRWDTSIEPQTAWTYYMNTNKNDTTK